MSRGVTTVPLEHLYTARGKYVEVFPQDVRPTVEGLVCIGGELTRDLLIEAYSKGIFPWYNDPPIQWFSPKERLVLALDAFRPSRSFRKWCRREGASLRHRADTTFSSVMKTCAAAPRKGQGEGTWINAEMMQAYQDLHQPGLAHSVEIWSEPPSTEEESLKGREALSEGNAVTSKLVGGLYGVSLGKIFFGESMFSTQTNTSKLALALLGQFLRKHDFMLIDCQVVSEHLLSLGAGVIKRHDFIKRLQESNTHATLKGPWTEIWRETCGETVAENRFDKPE